MYAKAGSIIAFGPPAESASAKPDPTELRIYAGTDWDFTLYEDENDNYNYEKGAYSTITFTWDNVKKVLTINDRKGSFPGMLNERKFNIVKVSKKNGVGMETVEKFDKVVTYEGRKIEVKL